MAMTLTEYHRLLDQTFSQGDREAALLVLPETLDSRC